MLTVRFAAMKKLLLLSLAALFGATLLRAEPTREQLIDRVLTCEAILQEISRDPASGPAKEAWKRAKAILILNQFKAGIVLGVQDGYGVIMVKRPDGSWSLPVLVNAGEASFGLQLGAKAVESLYLITDEATPRMLFKQRFNIGVDAKAVAGPKAAEKERNNQELLATPMLAYVKSRGLFAGATVKAGHLSRSDSANARLYLTQFTMPELLYGNFVQPIEQVKPLMALVDGLTR